MKILFVLLSLLTLPAWATTDPVNGTDLPGNQIVAGATVAGFGGTRYSTSSTTAVSARSYFTESAEGIVSIGLLGSPTSKALNEPLFVPITVSYIIEENGVMSAPKILKGSLTLQNRALAIPKAQWLSVTIDANVVVPATIMNNIVLKSVINTTSYSFNLPSTTLSHAATTDGNLQVSWTPVAGTEAYELEWTYVSDQSEIPGTRLTPQEVQIDRLLFKNNSSRVQTQNTSYQIPLVYEKGLILYRLRTVSKTISGNETVWNKSNWTSPDGLYGKIGGATGFPLANVYVFDGLELNLNWQSSISFAEEGKHKVVVSYHDGTARNRQAVTRINTDQRAVIGETMYDYNGRPAIQLLPVPVKDNTIAFRPHFNLVEDKSRMEKTDYDGTDLGNGCEVVVPEFTVETGASRYYSPLNDFGTSGNTGANMINKNLLPDAKKYPYTQTRYAPDNTGRISAQSGVGQTHLLGTGHETRYMYGAPQQEEISRLFGPQIGVAARFKKNAVIDPNNQVSVSYLNSEGKVVATALAGGNPGSLDPLNEDKARNLSATYLSGKNDAGNDLSTDYLTKSYNTKFIVTGANTPYKIDYSVKVPTFKIECSLAGSSNQSTIEFKGVVDVDIELFDKCGALLYKSPTFSSDSGSTGTGYTAQNLPLSNPPTITLNPDEYQLVKTVKINQARLDGYMAKYMNRKGVCVLADNVFKDQEKAKITDAGCEMDCQKCRTNLLKIRNQSNGYLTADDFEALEQACAEMCNDDGYTCRSSLNAMIGDLDRGGQYGEYRASPLTPPGAPTVTIDQNGNPVQSELDINLGGKEQGEIGLSSSSGNNGLDPLHYPLSVFNEKNSLKVHKFVADAVANPTPIMANWKFPLLIKPNNTKNGGVLTTEQLSLKSNNIIFDAAVSLEGADYDLTEYTDGSGNVFYVDVYRVPNDDNTAFYYKPEIDNNQTLEQNPTNSQLILVDALTGHYQIPAKYLKNLADFLPYFRSSWANFLIPYHPEYPYLVECSKDVQRYTVVTTETSSTSTQLITSSQTFDYQLFDSDLPKAIALGFIDANGYPTIFDKNDRSATKDPFFKTGPIENYNYMRSKYVNYTGQTSSSNYLAMNVIATMTVGCPTKGKEASQCDDVDCANGVIDTEEEWSAFRSLYTTEKQAIKATAAQKLAVDDTYYNGCIGHGDEVLSIPSEMYFRRAIPRSQVVDYIGRCKGWYESCGWGNLDKCGYWYDCVQQRTIYDVIYPYMDQDQVCGPSRIQDFKSKTPRFYPIANQSLNSGSRLPLRCSTLVNIGTEAVPVMQSVPIPCESDLLEFGDQVKAEAEYFKYETCGLCPLASDFETFIKEAATNRKLYTGTATGSKILVSCANPKTYDPVLGYVYPSIGEVLRRKFKEINGNALVDGIYWQSSTANNGRSFTGNFYQGSGSATPAAVVTLTIAVDDNATFAGAQVPTSVKSTSTLKIEDLTRICCLDVISVTGNTTQFRIKANYVEDLVNKELYLSGTFTMNLKDCSIPPRCLLTNDAYRPLLFLNTLCMKMEGTDNNGQPLPSKEHSLVGNLNFKALPASQVSIYNTAVRSFIGKNENIEPKIYLDDVFNSVSSCVWCSTFDATTGILTGQFNLQGLPSDYAAPLEGSTLAYGIIIESANGTKLTSDLLPQFNQFVNVRVAPVDISAGSDDPCKTNNCIKTSILADAFIPAQSDLIPAKYIPVKITLPSFKPVACKIPVAASPKP